MNNVLARVAITQSELFNRWPGDVIGRLVASSDVVTFDAATCIHQSGDNAEFLYLVASGSLEVLRQTAGRDFTAWRYFQGDFHGIGPVLASTPYEYALVCKERTVLVRVPAKLIRDAISNDGRLAFPLFSVLDHRYRDSLRRYESAATLSTRARVAGLLLSFIGRHTHNREAVEVNLSQVEIATMLGTRRQVVNRALRDLEANGAVKVQYGYVTVTNAAVLSKLIDDNPRHEDPEAS